jgi:TrmH family RNA methyltransferase
MKKKQLRRLADNSTSALLDEYSHLEFTVFLVEPEGSINVGSVSRIMKNFNFKHLLLFNPKCSIDSDARKYSMHAREDILEKAKVISLDSTIERKNYLGKLKKIFDSFDYVIGTSGKPSMFRNIKRINFYIDEVDFSILKSDSTVKIALVFGRESSGLLNDEIELCDFLTRIPTSDDYPALNLSHAVSIVLFTIFKKIHNIKRGTVVPSTREQRDLLFNKISTFLKQLDFKKDSDERILRAFKNIIGRSFASMKEINLFLTFILQLENKSRVFASDSNV